MIPVARIAALLPSLGRENGHEVVAAARAICAVLDGAGHDLHDFADFVRRDVAETVPAARPSTYWAPGHRARQPNSDRDRAQWLALYGGAALTVWEMNFVDSLVRQLGRRGSSASAKQSARLGQIFSRVSRAAA